MNIILLQIGPFVGPHILFLRLNEPDNSIRLNEHHFLEKFCRKLIFVLHGGWLKTLFKKNGSSSLAPCFQERDEWVHLPFRATTFIGFWISIFESFFEWLLNSLCSTDSSKATKNHWDFDLTQANFMLKPLSVLGTETLSVLFPRTKNILKIGLNKKKRRIYLRKSEQNAELFEK